MTLFLTSSPFVKNADRPILSDDNGFIDRIREALPPFPRCLFVCSDPERHDLTCRFGAELFMAFAQEGIFFESYQLLDGETAEQAEELVEASDFIVLAGGHVPTQNAFFRQIHLRELLEGFEGVVMGISAGSMNSAEFVYAQPEEEGESGPDFPRFLKGLGLADINILPHYQQVRDYELDGQRLYEDITYADSMGHEFFVFPDGTYYFQDDEESVILGEAWRLADGQMEKLTENGERFDFM